MPPKLKGKIYTTVVRPALIYGAKCWTMYDKFTRDLTTAEMKMCRMSLGVTKLDHIRSDRIRGSLHIKESIDEKLKHERSNWFEKVYKQDENHVAKKVIHYCIPAATRRGRPKHCWLRQLQEQQKKYGLTETERAERQSSRMTLRSTTRNLANPGD